MAQLCTSKYIFGPYGSVIGTAERIGRIAERCCGWCGEAESNASSSDNASKCTLTLLFGREELLYDIANIAYVEADIQQVREEHDRHQTFDITQDGNCDRVTRVLDLAHSLCVEALYPYTKGNVTDGFELSDIFSETDTYIISMRVPQTFSETTARLLEQLIHEFLICYTLYDWLAITKPEAAEAWKTKADTALAKVKRIINTRSTKMLRPLRPF